MWGGAGDKPSPPLVPSFSGLSQAAARGGGGGAGGGEIAAKVCETCGKAFSSDFFLSKHIGRRHSDLAHQQQQKLSEKKEEEEGGDGGKKCPVLEEALGPRGEGAGGGEKEEERELRDKEGGGEGGGRGGGAEVVEGARRLGELVREREHAKFRLEMEALRKEVADLKVCAWSMLGVCWARWRGVWSVLGVLGCLLLSLSSFCTCLYVVGH